MSSKFEIFKSLHHTSELFVLPNAWNPKSAMLLEKKGYAAIGTSSAAVANSLGYEDGEAMPFHEYLFIIKRILASITVPLTVDIEMGYGSTNENIYSNIKTLVEAGVVGINIEDSIIVSKKRTLQDSAVFAKRIEYIRDKLLEDRLFLFINVRCDTYILNLNNKEQETKSRLATYNSIGADGIFLPCITSASDINEAVNATRLPINVMCIPGLPDFPSLTKMGIKRASMGPFMFSKAYDNINTYSHAIRTAESFSPLL